MNNLQFKFLFNDDTIIYLMRLTIRVSFRKWLYKVLKLMLLMLANKGHDGQRHQGD